MQRKISFNHLAIIVLVLPVIWLIYSALVLDIEYYDSFDVILNAHYFLGEYPAYLAHKAPMLAIIMIPALWISKLLQLEALNLIVYHIEMAVLHITYLSVIFYLLIQIYGKKIPVIIAFTAAVLNFVFFSYGMFMNIDIFPGLLFFLMVLLSVSFQEKTSWTKWILLVLIGSIAASLKQTFGLFWVAVLIAHSVNLLIEKNWSKKSWITFLLLSLGSVSSFILYILLMCFVLHDSHMQGSFFSNPFIQILNFTKEYTNPDMIPPIWIYAINFPFYGILTTLLIIPGIILGLKSKDPLQRSLAVCWIAAFVFMHIICRREVRYIAFLAPISACLIIGPISYLIKKPRYLYLMLLILIIDIISAGIEAGRITKTFYQKSQLKQFLSPLKQTTNNICIINDYLCFIPPIKPAFLIDHYHRKFHFSPYHIKFFCRKDINLKWRPYKSKQLYESLPFKPESHLIYSNFFPINLKNVPDLSQYMLILARSSKIPFDPATLKIREEKDRKEIIYTFESRQLAVAIENYIFPGVHDKNSGIFFPLIQTGEQSFSIAKPPNYQKDFPVFNSMEFVGYKIKKYVYMQKNGTVLTNPDL